MNPRSFLIGSLMWLSIAASSVVVGVLILEGVFPRDTVAGVLLIAGGTLAAAGPVIGVIRRR